MQTSEARSTSGGVDGLFFAFILETLFCATGYLRRLIALHGAMYTLKPLVSNFSSPFLSCFRFIFESCC